MHSSPNTPISPGSGIRYPFRCRERTVFGAMETRPSQARELLQRRYQGNRSMSSATVLVGVALLLIPSIAGASSGAIQHQSPSPKIFAAALTSLSWSKLSPATRPPGVSGAMMAFDAADGYVVLFGGLNTTGCTNQTWGYLAGGWTQLHPTISPPSRCDGMMTYDAKDRYVILYGGLNAIYFNDTWTFAGGQWSQVNPVTNPGPLAFGSMTYDPRSGGVLLFGGSYDPCSCVTYISTGLYLFSKGSWTFKPSHVRPPGAAKDLPGANAAIAYDPKDGYMVEFGGWNHPSKNATTWNYSHGHWTRLSLTISPEWLFSPCLVFDPKLGYVVMFGGFDHVNSSSPNSTWEFLGGSWTLLHPSQSPPGDVAPAASTYDVADGYVILFGGQNTTSKVPSNDTWELR
jgi:hypothetical protein